ncbi:MAG: amidase [Gammaproteobacteria bacterium]
MSSAAPHYLDLTALSALLRQRELSPVAVTEAQLARIAALDGDLKSYAAVMADTALAEARAAEQEITAGRWRGPLHGVPLAVKDLCDATGVRTVAGMPRVRGAVPPASADATVVARLRAAGAVILGKLQLTEGAVAHHHPDVPPPVNPHHAGYWSGASSSGTGVAVAAGLCYGGLGSDTGGSIRLPSFANGVTGLKPSWGRVSRAGVFALAWSFDHVGPMARSAADCGAILNAIAGADPADPTALQAPVPDHLYKLDGDLRGLRVGLDAAWASYGIDAPTQQALEACLAVLKDAGATVVPVKMPDTRAALTAWTPMCCAEVAATHADNYPSRAPEYGPGLKGLIEAGSATSGLDYARAHDVRQQFRGQMAALFRGVDVLLAPAFLGQNMTLERFASFGSEVDDWDNLLRYTAPFDVSGSPTLSLPAGFNADGAPFGFQLVADLLNEPLLVRAGDAWQRATDHHRRRPTLAP